MAKRGGRQEGNGNVVWRCFFFWLAPVLFLYVSLLRGGARRERPTELEAVATLALLLVVSAANLIADCWLRCRTGLAVIQLVVQALVILSQTDVVYISVAPNEPMQATNVAPVIQAPAAATQRAAALPDAEHSERPRGRVPLLSRHHAEVQQEAETMSIVLPCLNETQFVVKTVRRFCERTPQELLKEIIVVDDGSTPPLEGELQKAGIDERCRLRVLRHKIPWGLMIAKQTGGDAALGKYIGFYDCHVAPAKDWYKETFALLHASPRRLVVPMIGDLDLDSWDERVGGALTAKCYINFNADFWWYDDESDNIPVISGGLVATSREWWQLSGGFDKGMRGWGGENTDQSLRAWLCGGDVLRAKSSRIAHMWRVPADRRTLAKYKLKTQTDNLARVAAIWFDEFEPKFRGGNLRHDINVSEARAMRQRLHCKPFVHFLHRFRRVYMDGGLLPDTVFKIRNIESQKCLMRNGPGYALRDCSHGSLFHMANMIPAAFPPVSSSGVGLDVEPQLEQEEVVCGGHRAKSCSQCPQGHGMGWCNVDCMWTFGACVNRKQYIKQQKEQRSKRRCCSGIREWNSLDCLDRLDPLGPLPYSCDVTGKNENQQYLWDSKGRIRHFHAKCLDVGPDKKLKAGDCDAAARWEKIELFPPPERQIYEEAVKKYGLTDDMPDH